jgi:hypothetical protein
MSNKAMKATHGDVLGHEVEQPRRTGQGGRNLSGRRAMFTRRHGRISYRGTTRHRDTQVAAGHPLAGLYSRWIDATRSSRPGVRALAHSKLAGVPTYPVIVDETVEADL